MEFVDLTGATGQTYRFRRWPEHDHRPRIAGHYVVVCTATRDVAQLGVLDNLADAAAAVGPLDKGHALFTRLNVSRVVREAEHSDLAAGLAPQDSVAA